MDDDDLRRGKPTIHKKWDEATAILAGDALQTFSFQLLSDPRFRIRDEYRQKLIYQLSLASGADGMVLGQALDILAETADTALNLDDIIRMQRMKTGALIEWSACSGAVMIGENPSALLEYSKSVGLAFQIIDDILDVEGDPLKVGKRLNKDNSAGKATFVSLLGMDTAKKHSSLLIDKAHEALAPYGVKQRTCDSWQVSLFRAINELNRGQRMSQRPDTPMLDQVQIPADLKRFTDQELKVLADELRKETISAVSETGGHLGAGLGVIELSVALHNVFDAPKIRLSGT